VWAESGQDRIGAGDCSLQHSGVHRCEVSGNGTHLVSQLARVPGDSGDVMARRDGLLEELPADPSGCRDNRNVLYSLGRLRVCAKHVRRAP
jgi:hypothetical protein